MEVILPKYLIWYVRGENQKKLLTVQKFSEHSNRRDWELEIIKLSKLKIITQLKFIKL